ncbi:MAG TPA: response regulator [Anseongella sp.]|nr:response regulator [Anseongella sp.]
MSTKSILIVDDDSDDRELFRDAVLEVDSSVECIACRNGEEMLLLLSQKDPFIPSYIFLDMNMPLLNGRQCFKELREREQFREIPVIIYTTSKLSKDMQEMIKEENVYFMTKPYRFDDLRKSIANVLAEDWEKMNGTVNAPSR